MSIGVLAKDGHILSYNNQPLEAKNYAPSTGPVAKKDINFYDYDGTLLYSYELSELPLSTLPDAPDHSSDEVPLTFQEWNWSIEDINALTRNMDVGAIYIPTDGKTHFLIHIENSERMTLPITFSQTVSEGVVWNFGDGTANQAVSGTGQLAVSHTYANTGDYEITASVNSGCAFGLPTYIIASSVTGQYAYRNMFRKVFIGLGITSIGSYAFQFCFSLQSITIPNSVTSIGMTAFSDCASLQSITISNSVTSIESYVFSNCYSLQSITIPNSVTSIGTYAFINCRSSKLITIPNGVTSIGHNAFYYCEALQSITIPNGVTSIEGSIFSECCSLSSITIPNRVTSIGNNVFLSCFSMKTYDFSLFTSVPTLANTNAFSGIPTDCKMLIPSALFSTWSTATNWSTYASYMQAV